MGVMKRKIIILIAIFAVFLQICGFRHVDSAFKEFDGPTADYTSEDVLLLANCIYFENWYNSMKVRALTGSVVINRVHSPYFPDTVQGVLSQRGQYATWKMFGTACLPKGALHQAEMLLKNGSVAPEDVLFQSMQPKLGKVWYTENGEYFARY